METLTSLGNFLGSTMGKTVMGLGTAGAGLVQNLQAYQKQKQVQDLISNPTKFNAMVAATEKPLSQGLTTDIARQSDAYGAERGLGSSPAIMKDVYAQALAPYQYQQQQAAVNSVLQRLGLMAGHPVQPIDVSSIFKALSMGGTAKPPGLPTPTGAVTPSGTIDPSVWSSMGPMTLPNPTVDYGTGDFGPTTTLPDFGGGTASFG